jgi:hypothetical protein
MRFANFSASVQASQTAPIGRIATKGRPRGAAGAVMDAAQISMR